MDSDTFRITAARMAELEAAEVALSSISELLTHWTLQDSVITERDLIVLIMEVMETAGLTVAAEHAVEPAPGAPEPSNVVPFARQGDLKG